MEGAIDECSKIVLLNGGQARYARCKILSIAFELERNPQAIDRLSIDSVRNLEKIFRIARQEKLFRPEINAKLERYVAVMSKVQTEQPEFQLTDSLSEEQPTSAYLSDETSNTDYSAREDSFINDSLTDEVAAEQEAILPMDLTESIECYRLLAGETETNATNLTQSDQVEANEVGDEEKCQEESVSIWKMWKSGKGPVFDVMQIEYFLLKNGSALQKIPTNELYLLPYEAFHCLTKDKQRVTLFSTGILIPRNISDKIFDPGRKSLQAIEPMIEASLSFRRTDDKSNWSYLIVTASKISSLNKVHKFMHFIITRNIIFDYEQLLSICYMCVHRSSKHSSMSAKGVNRRNGNGSYAKAKNGKTGKRSTASAQDGSPKNRDFLTQLEEEMNLIRELIGPDKLRDAVENFMKNTKRLAQQPIRDRIVVIRKKTGRLMGRYGCIAAIIEHLAQVCLVFDHPGGKNSTIKIRTNNAENCKMAKDLIFMILDGTMKIGGLSDFLITKHLSILTDPDDPEQQCQTC